MFTVCISVNPQSVQHVLLVDKRCSGLTRSVCHIKSVHVTGEGTQELSWTLDSTSVITVSSNCQTSEHLYQCPSICFASSREEFWKFFQKLFRSQSRKGWLLLLLLLKFIIFYYLKGFLI